MTEKIDAPEVIETPAEGIEPIDPENVDELDPSKAPPPPENETPEQKDARISELQTKNEKLWGWNQRLRNRKPPASPQPPQPAAQPPQKPEEAAKPGLSRDEAILFARGFSEEEVEHAKRVAELQGVKLTEAVNDDLFTGWKAKRDKEAKERQAQLSASRGSKATQKKSFSTRGLSDEEHEELFREKTGS